MSLRFAKRKIICIFTILYNFFQRYVRNICITRLQEKKIGERTREPPVPIVEWVYGEKFKYEIRDNERENL